MSLIAIRAPTRQHLHLIALLSGASTDGQTFILLYEIPLGITYGDFLLIPFIVLTHHVSYQCGFSCINKFYLQHTNPKEATTQGNVLPMLSNGIQM